MDAQMGSQTLHSCAQVFSWAPRFTREELGLPASGQGLPPGPLQGPVSKGALHATSFWPREGSFCRSAVTSKPFWPQGLFRAPCLDKGSPPADLFLPPWPVLAICSKPSHYYQQAARQAIKSPVSSQRILLPQQGASCQPLPALVSHAALWRAPAPGAVATPRHATPRTWGRGRGSHAPKQTCRGWRRKGLGEGWPLPATRCTNLLLICHKNTAENYYHHWGGGRNRLSHLQRGKGQQSAFKWAALSLLTSFSFA